MDGIHAAVAQKLGGHSVHSFVRKSVLQVTHEAVVLHCLAEHGFVVRRGYIHIMINIVIRNAYNPHKVILAAGTHVYLVPSLY